MKNISVFKKGLHCRFVDTVRLKPFDFDSHLHISSEGFVRVFQAVPVLPTKSERHTRQAEGTMFGYFCIHRLGPGRVSHREVLIQQLLGDHVL